MNIVLIGGRGVGKSKISRLLSCKLKRPVFPLDELIVYEENGKSIPEIVEDHDWHYFRDVEYKVAEKVSKLDDAIIDCGGGIIIDLDENGNEYFSERKINALKKTGYIIWLTDDLEYLAKKIQDDPNRPDLSKTKSFMEIMERREPFYRKAADYIYSKKNIRKKRAVKEIIKILQNNNVI